VLSPWHLYGRFLPQPKPSWWAQFFAGFKRGALPPKPRRPLVLPDEGWARVVRLCRELPPPQRLAVMSRYARACAGR